MPQLQFISGPLESNVVILPDREVSIGRHQGCDLVLPDLKASGKHAVLRRKDSAWWIHDLNSSNGLMVNGQETKTSMLNEGDQITIGDSVFAFSLAAEPEATDSESSSGENEFTGEAQAAAGAKVYRKTPPPDPTEGDLDQGDLEIIAELNDAYSRMTEQLGRVIVGQSDVIEQVLVSILCKGHALLIGVPGLAKTLLVSTLSQVLSLEYKRVQFTPDLMPSDITGTDVLEEDPATGRRTFRFVKGPIFTNMLLADEINRTPPKTQAALLEAMQERLVTIGEESYRLPNPFFVLATQNPIEQEGTYPLPEAQLDRFMFNILVKYPTAEEESRIIRQVTGTKTPDLQMALDGATLLRLQEVVRRVPVADHVIDTARKLVRATRPREDEAPEFVREMVSWGAGPRAGIYLILAAKAYAILHGRYHATTRDVFRAAAPVLRHRVMTTFNAEAAGVTSDEIIRRLVEVTQSEAKLDI